MSSILTNASALTAVANLAATQASLAQVQNEVSTGLKISSAEDNASYFSIATTLRTNVGNLGAVSDALNLGKSVVGTATAAITGITSTLQSLSNQLVAAQQPGADLNAIGTQIAALNNQLAAAVSTASFNGVNLLDGSQGSAGQTGAPNASDSFVTFVSGVTGAGTSSAKVTNLFVDTTSTNLSTASGGALAGVAAITVTGGTTPTTSAALTTDLQTVSTALAAVNTASETLGSAGATIDQQSTFTSALSDSLTTGIGSLVDADLNEASTRLNALQTQQQLGVQALSVANQNSQIILKLFQG